VWGAGFQPTPREEIEKAGRMLGLKKGVQVYDLGSGFGRVVIELAKKYRVKCVGIEIDPIKYWWSKQAVKRNHLTDKIVIKRKNLLEVDLSSADAVFVFLSGGTRIMSRLEKKILSEMKQGSKVISYSHRFDRDWEADRQEGELFLYTVQKSFSENTENRRTPTE